MDRILGEDGPPHRRVRFTITDFEDNRLFDIRKYYLPRNPDSLTGRREFRPTKMGISLTRDNYIELRRVQETHNEDILEFLKIGQVREGMLRYHQAELEAKEKGFRLANKIEIREVDNFRDSHLFHVSHQGAKDVVELNTNHPFAKAISIEEITNSSPEEVRELFATMMATFARARSLLLGASASNPEILFEQTEFDWSKFLEKYVEEV
jgi:hypothetical protein